MHSHHFQIISILFSPRLETLRETIWHDLSAKSVELVRKIYSKPNDLQPQWLHKKAPLAMRINTKKLIFLGFSDGHIEIWNLQKRLLQLVAHEGAITSFLFLTDALWASSSLDGTICIWNGHESAERIHQIILKIPIYHLYLHSKSCFAVDNSLRIHKINTTGSHEKTKKFLQKKQLNAMQNGQLSEDKEKFLLRSKSEPKLSNKAPEKPRKKTL